MPLVASRVIRRWRHALLMLLLPATGVAQSRDSVRVPAPVSNAAAPARWHLQTSTFYSSANNGFGVWRGQDARLLYSAARLSPFVSVGTQSRPSGRQATYGVGSYLVLTKWAYSIVGVGTAPGTATVLFPRLRSDASLILSVPRAKGLLVSTGITDLRYPDRRAGGRILSAGPMLYHGRGIYNASVYFNRDRASGARSTSWQAGGQWGAQGQYWIGGGIGSGNEAYRLLSVTPFDARFTSRSASVFASKWVTRNSGVSIRVDLEHKIDVFDRRAVALTYFVDF